MTATIRTPLQAVQARITAQWRELCRARIECNRCPSAENLRRENDAERRLNELLDWDYRRVRP